MMNSIQQNDLVGDVLARDEQLVDVLARHAAHFAQLRDPAARRTMGALVTVEQAARIAGITPSVLVDDLNAALGFIEGREGKDELSAELGAESVAADTATHDDSPRAADAAPCDDASPPEPRWPGSATVSELDVRDDLRSGREPFSRIMAAIAALRPEHVLLLRTTFEPAPLYAVLGRRGFMHAAERHADDDWSVRLWRPSSPATGERTTGTAAVVGPPGREVTSTDDDVHWLDVRGLEPPEPMARTLALLEALPDGHTLVQVNVRTPQFLLPILAERGFAFSIDESDSDRVLVRIHRGI